MDYGEYELIAQCFSSVINWLSKNLQNEVHLGELANCGSFSRILFKKESRLSMLFIQTKSKCSSFSTTWHDMTWHAETVIYVQLHSQVRHLGVSASQHLGYSRFWDAEKPMWRTSEFAQAIIR